VLSDCVLYSLASGFCSSVTNYRTIRAWDKVRISRLELGLEQSLINFFTQGGSNPIFIDAQLKYLGKKSVERGEGGSERKCLLKKPGDRGGMAPSGRGRLKFFSGNRDNSSGDSSYLRGNILLFQGGIKVNQVDFSTLPLRDDTGLGLDLQLV